jgi:hypothetical protein
MSEKPKRLWKVDCPLCETTLNLDVDEFKVTSTDQGAEFIRQPLFVCGKCGTYCRVRLSKEKKDV